jgi:hypothetical protein
MTDTDRAARRAALGVLAIGVVITAWRAADVARSMGVLDDAFMYVRYARHFLGGLGHAWNPDGVHTYGSTSLVQFALVTLIQAVAGAHASHEVIVRASSIGPGLVAVVVLAALVMRTTSGWGTVDGALALIWLIDTRLWAIHLVSGMDTMTSVLALSILIYVTLRGGARQPWRVAVVAYVAFLSRPDNGVYAVMFAPLYVLFVESGVDGRRWCLRYAGVLAACFVVGGGATYAVFHDVLPLPFYAKQSGYLATYAGAVQWNPFVYLNDLIHATWPLVAVVLVGASWRTALAFVTPAILTIGYFFTVVQVMGSDARFYFPSTVFLLAAAILAVNRLLNAPVTRQWLPARAAACLLLLVTPRAVSHAAVRWQSRVPRISTVDPLRNEYFTVAATQRLPDVANIKLEGSVGARFAAALPSGTITAMSEHGYIGANSPDLTIVDLVGLHDRVIAHHGFSMTDLLSRHVDVVWGPHPDYTGIVRAMLSSAEFQREYAYYPGAFNFGVAIRHASSRYATIDSVFAAEFSRTYPRFRREDYLARFVSDTTSAAHPPNDRARQ